MSFSVQREVYVVGLNGGAASRFQLEVRVRKAPVDWECILSYGPVDDVRTIRIVGIDSWQALMLGLKTLISLLTNSKAYRRATFFETEESALSLSGGVDVDGLFEGLQASLGGSEPEA